MPRSIQEILDHADELAARFEQLDPETRDVVQNVYIRRVEKVNGELLNVEFDKIENVKDPWKERMKK